MTVHTRCGFLPGHSKQDLRIETDDDPRKCLRESEINRSEKNVKDIMSAMMNDF